MGKIIKIAVGRFLHETTTFSPKPTTVEDWEYLGPPTRAIFDDPTYIGGFKSASEEYNDVKLVGITSPHRARGGSSGGWNTTEVFDKYSGLMVEDLKRIQDLDGVYLSLHGAMAVTDVPKPEAELIRRVRKTVGNIPIFVTLDLHANEDHELIDAADGVFIVKRYPHYDKWLQGERAARVMIQTIRGWYKPVMTIRKPAIITPSVYQGTGVSPAREIMERARRWECREPGAYISVAFGYAFADVPDVGATIIALTNNNQALADRIANDMNDYIWGVRETFAGKKLPKTKDGVAMAVKAAKAGKTPVVIADHSDRSGGSTHVLEELLTQKAENFCIATLRDEKVVESIKSDSQIGDSISAHVGGYADEYAGDAIHITGEIKYIGTYKNVPTVVIAIDNGNRVILTEHLMQVVDIDIFQHVGIDFDQLNIIVLKSRIHFRRGYDETGVAGAIFEVDAPGWGPADLSNLPYKNVPKGLYPLANK